MTGDSPTLLLLHGLGATSDVWQGLVELLPERWPGRVSCPDLPGHGAAAPLDTYSFGHLAAALAPIGPEPVVVLGHSLGGVLALTLATGWFGTRVVAAGAIGIKLDWSADELAKAAELAARPVRHFPDADAAIQRHLRTSGLTGLVDADDPRAARGVVHEDAGWRLALDPRAFGVGAPDVPGLLAATAGTRTLLAVGEHDPMCTPDQLHAISPKGTVLAGLGHNAHVEDPAALLPLLDALVA